MLFIWMLILATTAIAGSAAFFSVYGLAHTFSGVFWSTVVMGASLEAGKLVAASYLYRYWEKTHIALKSYLLTGIAALMLLTSGGIFGYLSTGYQQDVLPLKQKSEQVQLLTEERERALARKKQIDDLLASGPSVKEITNAQGTRALREATRAKESSARQYRDEHVQLTKRIGELDTQLLSLKQDLIQTEAHVGPIIYIAKAFDLASDDATKYLVLLIIFAFDPMAIALTLCVNIALRLRKEEEDALKQVDVPSVIDVPRAESDPQFDGFVDYNIDDGFPTEYVPDPEEDAFYKARNTFDFSAHDEFMKPIEAEEPTSEPVQVAAEIEVESVEPEPTPEPEPVEEVKPAIEPVRTPRVRPYANMWANGAPTSNKIAELVQHFRSIQAREDAGETLSKDELWEKEAIDRIIKQHGYDKYLK